MFPKSRTPHQCYIVIKGPSRFVTWQEPINILQSFTQRNRIVSADRCQRRRIKDEASFKSISKVGFLLDYWYTTLP